MGGSGIPGAVRCDIGIKIFQQKTDMACPVVALITMWWVPFLVQGLFTSDLYWFYVNSWGRAKIEQLEIVSECENSGKRSTTTRG